jgi:hypothetical protein
MVRMEWVNEITVAKFYQCKVEPIYETDLAHTQQTVTW